jgi:hypothetical protein
MHFGVFAAISLNVLASHMKIFLTRALRENNMQNVLPLLG